MLDKLLGQIFHNILEIINRKFDAFELVIDIVGMDSAKLR